MTGKEKCELLKAMRREIAEANGIIYLSADCTNQGNCRGYCEKCDAEARFLDAELNRLAKEGKTIKVTGFAYRSVLNSPLLFDDSCYNIFSRFGKKRGILTEKQVLEMPIEKLDLSEKTLKCLKRAGIKIVGDLEGMGFDEISRIRSLSKKGAQEVCRELDAWGLDFDNLFGPTLGLPLPGDYYDETDAVLDKNDEN